ncbi:MAG: D-alanine--D-alanine ligase [Coriobacteriia bacterium]|nr:D-alanine--D-alanine ligase [Coriobacteriia bacterium]MCL2536708.1 D-alanine--D-alanine ligase [Coriobacteriia bacterium]
MTLPEITATAARDISKLHIAVLQGGTSAEREVSLRTGENVSATYRELGCEVTVLDAADLDFIEKLRALQPDLVFIALHGSAGEDGTIQGLLEILGLPYTGSGVLASALAMNKQVSKQLFSHFGLRNPRGLLLKSGRESYEAVCTMLGTSSLVVKPNAEGSSVGVSLVECAQDYEAAFSQAACPDGQALVEECITGRELTVAVLGDAEGPAFPLPVIEIIPKTEFYHFDNKYTAHATEYVVPADLDEAVTNACMQLALDAHVVLGCQGYSRSDIKLRADGTAYLLETNTLPGLTSTSLIPKAAAAAGIDMADLLIRIAQYALNK